MAYLNAQIEQGHGDQPADLVLTGGRVFSLVAGTFITGDIVICGDSIVSIRDQYKGHEIINVSGFILLLGFIATHFHINQAL